MSTILNTNGDTLKVSPLHKDVGGTFYIVTAEWNKDITYALRYGAVETLRQAGVKEEKIRMIAVPGTVELVNAAALCLNLGETAAVIVIGCVIRGDTPHFDYVCSIAADGVSRMNARGDAPVIFGVLTVNSLEQAQERAGGVLGNKGAEAAAAAVEMANIHASILFTSTI